jgi:dolichyl-phosphate-mannose--protein O-mannosyl transferase
MWLFGAENSFSWRIAVAVLGIASVALVILVARLIFNSWFWANLAGLFLAIEGQAIVMSRTGLLDGSLAFFALLAFYFVIRDQNSRSIERLSFARPWLWTAGVALSSTAAELASPRCGSARLAQFRDFGSDRGFDLPC